MTEPTPGQSPAFSLEKIYIKDVSYEAPGVPGAFLQSQPPEIKVQLQIAHAALDAGQGLYEVVLTVTVTAEREKKSVFLVEVQQGGLFRVLGANGAALEQALEIACPHVLLPYAREAVDALIGKGGFPQLLIHPINFEALYAQKRAATAAPQTAGSA